MFIHNLWIQNIVVCLKCWNNNQLKKQRHENNQSTKANIDNHKKERSAIHNQPFECYCKKQKDQRKGDVRIRVTTNKQKTRRPALKQMRGFRVQTKNNYKMDYNKFYKTTTKQELFAMVVELSEIADIAGDAERMIETTRKLIRHQIDSDQFWETVNKQ